MAPEMLASVNPEGYSGKAADIWSFGVTMFAFSFLKIPFSGDSVPELA
jgi:[calcium/calmodulin-dependent protein kinase] kinase